MFPRLQEGIYVDFQKPCHWTSYTMANSRKMAMKFSDCSEKYEMISRLLRHSYSDSYHSFTEAIHPKPSEKSSMLWLKIQRTRK